MKQQTTSSPPKISIAPPQSSNLKRDTPSPQISPKDEPDLINLESAKSSPVPSMKKSTNSSSSDSLDQILNKADIHVSDTDSSDEKILTSPPIIISPPPAESIDSPSKHSSDSKADSLDSIDELKTKNNEEIGEDDNSTDVNSPTKTNEVKDSQEELSQVTTDTKTEAKSPTKSPVKECCDKDEEGNQFDETECIKQDSKIDISEENADNTNHNDEPNKGIEITTDSETNNVEGDVVKECDEVAEEGEIAEGEVPEEEKEIGKITEEEVNELESEIKAMSEIDEKKPEIEKDQLDSTTAESAEDPTQSQKVNYFSRIK